MGMGTHGHGLGKAILQTQAQWTRTMINRHRRVVRMLPIALAVVAFGWAFYCRFGPELSVSVDDNGWPTRVRFSHGIHAREVYAFNSPNVHPLFRADFETLSELNINRYAEGGGLILLPDGLARGDIVGRYESRDNRDHLASPYLTPQGKETGLFLFSAWVRPQDGGPPPALWLQDENYAFVSQAQERLKRSDGWVLLLGFAEKTGAERVRLVVMGKPGTVSLIDKVLLVEATR